MKKSLITLIGIIIITSFSIGMIFGLFVGLASKPEDDSRLILGGDGSIELAKLEDLDTIYLKAGDLITTNNVEHIESEQMYYNDIKVEVGQEWSCCGDPFNEPVIRIITDIKGDYIQFKYRSSGHESSFHKCIFFPTGSKLLKTKNGYVIKKGTVSNINTKDLYKK